jgi:pimeloyl-ACP methyl ester carboxylesterase
MSVETVEKFHPAKRKAQQTPLADLDWKLLRIAVPTLILSAADDPFIRLTPETRARILSNPHIRFVETRHGGHCAFLARRSAGGHWVAHWAEDTVVRYLQAVAAGEPSAIEPRAAFTSQLQY